MDNQVSRYGNRTAAVPWRDRVIGREAQAVTDETRMAAHKADGALALAGHMMEGLVSLDSHRKALTNGDPITEVMLSQIQAEAIRALGKIQRGLFNDWGL